MGLIDDILESSHDKGKSDGAKGNVDFISYALDKDYREGVDDAEGEKDGSKLVKDEDKGGVAQIAADAIFGREGFEKMGKSEAYKRSYDWGKDTYGKKGWEIDNLRRESEGRKSSGGSSGGYGEGSGGSVGYGHGKESSWIWVIVGLLISLMILGGIISVLSDVWSSSSSKFVFDSGYMTPDNPFYTYFHTGVPTDTISAAPLDCSIVLTPSEPPLGILSPVETELSGCYFEEGGWYVNSTALHSSPDGGKTWYVLLTVKNMPKRYRQILHFSIIEREDGKYLIIMLMDDMRSQIWSTDEGRTWIHIKFDKHGNGRILSRTYDYGKTWA